MFEECFSMIELNALTEQSDTTAADILPETAIDDLQSFLVSALDEALSKLDEEFSTVH